MEDYKDRLAKTIERKYSEREKAIKQELYGRVREIELIIQGLELAFHISRSY